MEVGLESQTYWLGQCASWKHWSCLWVMNNLMMILYTHIIAYIKQAWYKPRFIPIMCRRARVRGEYDFVDIYQPKCNYSFQFHLIFKRQNSSEISNWVKMEWCSAKAEWLSIKKHMMWHGTIKLLELPCTFVRNVFFIPSHSRSPIDVLACMFHLGCLYAVFGREFVIWVFLFVIWSFVFDICLRVCIWYLGLPIWYLGLYIWYLERYVFGTLYLSVPLSKTVFVRCEALLHKTRFVQ